ncbi:hypothetical protein [Actinopolymorpha pittospori]
MTKPADTISRHGLGRLDNDSTSRGKEALHALSPQDSGHDSVRDRTGHHAAAGVTLEGVLVS